MYCIKVIPEDVIRNQIDHLAIIIGVGIYNRRRANVDIDHMLRVRGLRLKMPDRQITIIRLRQGRIKVWLTDWIENCRIVWCSLFLKYMVVVDSSKKRVEWITRSNWNFVEVLKTLSLEILEIHSDLEYVNLWLHYRQMRRRIYLSTKKYNKSTTCCWYWQS